MSTAYPRVQTSAPRLRSLVRRLAYSCMATLLVGAFAATSGPVVVEAAAPTGNATIKVEGGLASVVASPLTLIPAFDPSITDYVLRCAAGTNTIQMTLNAVRGGSLNVNGNRSSTVTIQESLFENQALVISANRLHISDQQSINEGSDNSDPANTQYWIRCLPHDFPQLDVSKPGNPPPGWYLTSNLNSASGSQPYSMVLDNNGTPVWYRRPGRGGVTAVNVTPLPDGTIAWAGAPAEFEVYNLRTQATRLVSPPDSAFDAHELHALPNGDVMVLSNPDKPNVDLTPLGLSSNTTITDCVIEELDPGGAVVWRWRASDHISPQESLHPSAGGDIFHCNSVDTDPESGNVLLSSRHTDAIYLINKATGMIIWKMGGNSLNHDHAQILTITGDPEGVFHAQHDARFRPNGDVSLFDDQTWDTNLAARGVEYQVDNAAGTATLVWAYQSPDGRNSQATGSFRRLNGGADNLVGWGIRSNAILFTEVDAQGRVMLSVTFPNDEWSYRAIKVPVTALDHGFLRATAGLPPFVRPTSPTIAFVGSAPGPVKAGAAVTITGTGFTGATAVSFGPNPAAAFTVNNDSSITAIAPSGSGLVSVTVTTPGGTTPTTAESILTAVDSGLEGDIGSWRSAVSLAPSTSYAQSGAYSLQLSPPSVGGQSVASGRYAVPARAMVTSSVWVLTPRQQDRVRAFVAFYDSNGALIQIAKGATATIVSGAWTLLAETTTSPPRTVSAALGLEDISGTDAVYLDSASLIGSDQYAYQPPNHGD